MELAGKKILIVGAARSGIAAAKVLLQLGAQVVLTDVKKKEALLEALQPLEGLPVVIAAGVYPLVDPEHTDLVITSPGVPLQEAPLAAALQQGIPVWGELELAYRFLEGPVVAITGTNGKTTTTSLLGQMLKNAGQPAVVAGNIGIPLIQEIHWLTKEHVVVLEVSSFQLETAPNFHPRVAAILNITPDHLDRHGNMEGYIQAKAKVFANQGPTDYTVLNFDDPITRGLAEKTNGQVIFFSRRHTLEQGVFLDSGQIRFKWRELDEVFCPADEVAIKGAHNLENAMASVACAAVMGIDSQQIRYTLRTFPGVAHRLEPVATIHGVEYVNDSKGTNPDATIKALESFDRPLILIAGGKNKGSDFAPLAGVIRERVKCLILLGEAAPDINSAVKASGFQEVHLAKTYAEAVETAARLATSGDVVLLSPACASWDMFANYEERGDTFKRLVLSQEG
ncbi:MAG: UDP-N-acetylmuramoyl-L-alanine--D-glutamate ligase [Bacillota bacterium]